MRTVQTTQEPPVILPDPTRPPKPTPGCTTCAANDRQRAAAEHAGDIQTATAREVEIRNHPKHRQVATQ